MKTTINYVDYSFSPWWGCSGGCPYCFARKVALRFGRDFDTLTQVSEATWKHPLKWNRVAMHEDFRECGYCGWRGRPKPAPHTCPNCGWDGGTVRVRPRVLCGTMCDWLDTAAYESWLERLVKMVEDTPVLDWLMLTKRPEDYRAVRGDRLPDNLWFGVTAETQGAFDRRWPEAVAVPAVKRWLSAEPLLGTIRLNGSRPDWVVIGCRSGKPAGAAEAAAFNRHAFGLVAECRAEGIPVWVKQAYDKRGRAVDRPEDMPAHEWARTRVAPIAAKAARPGTEQMGFFREMK